MLQDSPVGALLRCKTCMICAAIILIAIIWLFLRSDNQTAQTPGSATISVSELIGKSFNVTQCVDIDGATDFRSNRQIASLRNVYFGGDKSLAQLTSLFCMSDSAADSALQRLQQATEADRRTLADYYADPMLRLVALRDTDEDGILDFRIKEFGGFISNDPDADNDGVQNIYDAHPLSAGAVQDAIINNDHDHDGLPNHLDWSDKGRFPGKSQALIDIQYDVFSNYGIVLNETDLGFTVSAASMVQDALKVFADQITSDESSIKDTFKIVTSAQAYDVDPYGVLAEVSPVNGRVNLFALAFNSIDSNPGSRLAAFAVMVHEMTHAIQNAMDYESNRDDLLRYNFHRKPTNFVQMANSLGWKMSLKENPEFSQKAFVDHGSEGIGADEVYAGMNFQELGALYDNMTDSEEIRTFRKDYKIVTPYSLMDSREWHAEYVTVTLLIHMYKRFEITHGSSAEMLIECAQKAMSDEWNGEPYRYQLADPVAVEKIAATLTLTDEVLDELNQKYIATPYADGCE